MIISFRSVYCSGCGSRTLKCWIGCTPYCASILYSNTTYLVADPAADPASCSRSSRSSRSSRKNSVPSSLTLAAYILWIGCCISYMYCCSAALLRSGQPDTPHQRHPTPQNYTRDHSIGFISRIGG